VTLTRAGIDFLPKAQRALAGLEQSFDELKQQGAKRRDRLDIACLPVFAVNYLPSILSRFHDLQPGMQVRVSEAPSAAIAELVQSGEVEFGLSVTQPNRWDLETESIASSPLALACPSRHPLAKKRSIGWGQLRNLPLIRVGSKTAIRPTIDVALHRGRGLVADPLRAPTLACTYGLVRRRGIPLSPPVAKLRGFLIDEMKGKDGLHAPNV
jgi:DNA-binding transcriptional LysR family regulator